MPPNVIESVNSQEMKIRFKNNSILQLTGSDSYDRSLIGTNVYGIVYSEYALADPRAYLYARPILSAQDGWCIMLSTPRGHNHLYELFNISQWSPDWFSYKLTLDDTQHIPMREIEKDRAEGLMSEDLIQQEYYTSFSLGIEGSFYSKYIDKMRLENRIAAVPWEPQFKVHTAWDIGVSDNCVIIFFQYVGPIVRIIDYYENNRQGLEHYTQYLTTKPYQYGVHIAPHDISVMEFGSGVTRIEKAAQLGVEFVIAHSVSGKSISRADGIEAVRTLFPKLWIDEVKCEKLIKCLENYRQEYDNDKKIYKPIPRHDWSSHSADAARYLAIGLHKVRDGLTPEELDSRYREAYWGNELPSMFDDKFRMY